LCYQPPQAIGDPALTVHVERVRQKLSGLALVEAGLAAAPQTVATCQVPIVHTGVLRERKDPYDASSSSKVLACFRSSVSENGKYYAGYREALRNLQAAIKARDSG
jgi:hypothetical protein